MSDLEVKKDDEQDAIQALKSARQARISACVAEIQGALKKHRCNLVPIVTIVSNQIDARVEVMIKE